MGILKLLSTSSLVLGMSFILRFVLTLTLARYLTSSELGVYSWTITAFGIACIITNFGLDYFLIRKVPEYRNISMGMVGALIKNVRNRSMKIVFLLILLILPLSFLLVYFFENAAIYQNELIIVIFALPFAAISLIYSTSLRGFDFPLKAQIIESLLHTGLVLILVFLSFTIFNSLIPFDSRTIVLICIFLFSWVFSSFVSFFTFKKSVQLPPIDTPSKENIKNWRGDQSSIVIGTLGWSFLGRSDIFLLAFLVSPEEVGTYFICLRLAETLMFFATVSYYVWGREISNLIQKNKLNKTQEILKKSSQLCISTTLIMSCTAFIYAEEILFLINERYVESSYLLRIALITFFIKGAAGIMRPLYYILGEQKFLAKCQWIIGLFFTTSVLITVPFYGLIACISSFAVCEIIFFLILLFRLKAKHKLSISPI